MTTDRALEAAAQTHPHYAEGFWEAMEGEPLFDDASEPYRIGWQAFHKVRAELRALKEGV